MVRGVKKSRDKLRAAYERAEDSRSSYVLGREIGNDFSRLPYTGIPHYLEVRKGEVDQKYGGKKGVYKDLGIADKLVDAGVNTNGQQFIDAIRAYNLAIRAARNLGDSRLASQVYSRAITKISRARTRLNKMREGNVFSNVLPIVKLSKLENAARDLGRLGDYDSAEPESAGYMKYAGVFLGISLITFILMFFMDLTGAVIGVSTKSWAGIVAFIFLIIGLYFLTIRKKSDF